MYNFSESLIALAKAGHYRKLDRSVENKKGLHKEEMAIREKTTNKKSNVVIQFSYTGFTWK